LRANARDVGRAVVADASPLIALAGIGQLELLAELYGRIRIPGAVWREVTERGFDRPGAAAVRDAAWLDVVEVEPTEDLRSLLGSLGPGEAEALCLLSEAGAGLFVADDQRARRRAATLGIDTIGTLGVLIDAQRVGLIEDAETEFDALEAIGFYVSEAHRALAVSLLSE